MKTVCFLLILTVSVSYGQGTTNRVPATRDSVGSVITVFYFGGSDCSNCVKPKEIANIKTLRRELPKKHPEAGFKFVLVVMDTDIPQGIRYARKYPNWNELSIGSFYNNELMLQHVNGTKLPGVPQLMIYRNTLVKRIDFSVPILRSRTLIADLVGGSKIQKWMQAAYPLEDQ